MPTTTTKLNDHAAVGILARAMQSMSGAYVYTDSGSRDTRDDP
jgi:hypothetical protein